MKDDGRDKTTKSKRLERSEHRKLTNTWEYWKRTLSSGDERKNGKKNTSGERENYMKLNYIVEITSKG